MGQGHGHGHGHGIGSATGRHRWRLAASLGLIGTYFVVELAFALISGSLALLSDAGHMAADVVTLAAALVATRIAARPDSTGRRTYGSYRAEVFASGLAVLLMLGVAVYIVAEAIGRIGTTAEVETGPMLIVGVIGLVVNVAAMVLLRSGASESLNVKGAYLEVVADTAGSVGVIAVARALMLGRQVVAVLAQHAPEGMNADAVADDLSAIDGVADVHDLHLWTLTSGMPVATAHLVAHDQVDTHAVLDRARDVLRQRHGVAHATLQVEPSTHHGCEELGW
jgi:cobalt-zinc-cadmium efflux system protein